MLSSRAGDTIPNSRTNAGYVPVPPLSRGRSLDSPLGYLGGYLRRNPPDEILRHLAGAPPGYLEGSGPDALPGNTLKHPAGFPGSHLPCLPAGCPLGYSPDCAPGYPGGNSPLALCAGARYSPRFRGHVPRRGSVVNSLPRERVVGECHEQIAESAEVEVVLVCLHCPGDEVLNTFNLGSAPAVDMA